MWYRIATYATTCFFSKSDNICERPSFQKGVVIKCMDAIFERRITFYLDGIGHKYVFKEHKWKKLNLVALFPVQHSL